MISNKCHYALKALLELAKREGAGPATIVEIAQAQGIPARFLEAILRQLKQAGLTESVRGKRGGYVLAKPARMISVGDVVQLMEGPYFGTEALEEDNASRPDVFRPIWRDAEVALNEVYQATSFADLVEADRKAAADYVPDYTI